MPFAGYEDFEACVQAHSDKDNPEAYSATVKRLVEGQSEEFDRLELGAVLKTADEHSDEMLAELLQAAIAEQEAVEQQAEVDAVTLHFPPGGEVIDHEAGDWDQFLDDLSKHGDVFQMWKGVQRHPEDTLESHDHATHVALEADKDVTDIEAVLDDHPAVEYVIDPASVSTFDKPEDWEPADSDHVITPDQQAVITGLSQEAIDAIERRHNVDVEVVDGEGSATPTDSKSPNSDE